MAKISRSKSYKPRDIVAIEPGKEADDGLVDFTYSSTDSFLLFDEDLHCVGINPAGQALFNVLEEDVVGKHIMGILSEAPNQEAHEQFLTVIRTGEHVVTSLKLGDRYLGVKAFKVGNGLGIIASDITERKLMEEKLYKASEYWRCLFDSLEDIVLVIDRDYNVENVNDNGLALLGKTREEVAGEKCYRVIYDRDKPDSFCPLLKVLKTGKAVSAEGELFGRHYSIKISPISDEKGEIISFVELLRDITERREVGGERVEHRPVEPKRTNEMLRRQVTEPKQIAGESGEHLKDIEAQVEERTAELRNANERLQKELVECKLASRELKAKDSAVALSLNAVVMADLESKLTYVNPSFLRMWGYENEDGALGKPVTGFWQAGRKVAEVIKILRQKGTWTGELSAVRKDGSVFPVELSASMIEDENGEPVCIVASCIDVTERRRVEERLSEYEDKLNAVSAKSTEWVKRLDAVLNVFEETKNGASDLPDEKQAREQ